MTGKSAKRRHKLARERKNRTKKVCPIHAIELKYAPRTNTDFWVCPEPGCEIGCGGGTTSTPCDAETDRLRQRAHAALDPLWKNKTPFHSRDAAYAWLAGVLGIAERDCHVGYFTADQCRAVLKAVRTLTTP